MEEAVQKDEAYYRDLYRVDMGMISTEGLLTELLRRCHGSKNLKGLLKDVRASCFSMRVYDGASTVVGDMVQFLDEVEGDREGDEPEDWTVVDLHGHCDRWGHGTLILENAQKDKIKSASDTVVIVTEKQWEL